MDWLPYSSHTSHPSSQTPSRPSLNLLCHSKTDARFIQDAPKAVWSIPYFTMVFFPSLKHNFIAYRSSKVSSNPDCIFEIHQLWQSGFIRVHSNYCCSCSFESEIIKIGQLSHNMYSTNIVNFQESATNFNAWTKNVWKLLKALYIYIYISSSRHYINHHGLYAIKYNQTKPNLFWYRKFFFKFFPVSLTNCGVDLLIGSAIDMTLNNLMARLH